MICFPEEASDTSSYLFRPELSTRPLDQPQLLTQLGFLHIDTNRRLTNRLEAILDNICELEAAAWKSKLQSLAGTDNPYALLDRYGPGHTVQVAGNAAYIVQCTQRIANHTEFQNCTQEVPVHLDGRLRFADPFTWIVHDFPTVVPCSPVMPVRWYLEGKWYCATPEVRPCPPPTRIQPQLNRTEAGDFARGLGRGIYTTQQIEQHRAYWRSTTSRRAVLSKAANVASQGGYGGHLGLFVSPLEVDELSDQIARLVFPLFPLLGYAWQIFSGVFLALVIVKTMVECVVRMAYIYLERGCGCWVLLGLWNTLYQLFHVPARIVKAAVAVARQEGDDPLALPDIPKADADSVEKGDGQGGPGGGPPAFATLGARPKGAAPPVPPAYSVPRLSLIHI